jgi:LuxR family transcriptional regulator, maltose regulon positive regulatory protein
MSSATQADIVGTKLFIPRARPGLVSREALTRRLDRGLSGSVTLTSAPAGFGKTTLLAGWLRQKQRDGYTVAWLSLEQGDSEPARFIRYLVAALRVWVPGLGADVLPLLDLSQPPAPAALLPGLVNDMLAQPGNCILVLDDYHVIDSPAVHEALNFLVDHLPPQLHLAITSREDPPLPLARLRARGQLCELRVADLRFTHEEAASFLRDGMGIELSPDQLAALESRTEGWIAGLQLAALSMRDQGDVESFIAAFTGRNRYILDYLLQEVLERLPPDTRQFLLYTSILDRLSAPLCAAVAGESESPQAVQRAQVMLGYLDRANLFLTPLDAERRWYRYHQLFADLLQAHLTTEEPERLAGLHSAAAAWYEANGMITEGIEHALAGADFERAARLVGLTFRRMTTVPRELRTAMSWYDALPPELIRSRPDLAVDYAGCMVVAGRLDEAEQSLRAAEHALEIARREPGSPDTLAGYAALAGLAAVVATLLASRRGHVHEAVEKSQQALDLLPPTEPAWRIATHVYLADAYQSAGDSAAAYDTLAEAEKLSGEYGNDLTTLTVLSQLAQLLMAQGRLGMAAATCRRIMQLPVLRNLPLVGTAYVGLGHVQLEQNDLAPALEHLTHGVTLLAQVSGLNTNIVAGYAHLARLHRAQGDEDAALSMLRQAEDIAAAARRPSVSLPAEWVRLRHLLAVGDVGAAGRLAGEVYENLEKLPPHRREPGLLAIVRVRLAQGSTDDALNMLEALGERAERAGRKGTLIEINVLQALALQQKGDGTRALQALLAALGPAEPEGYVRVFLDEGEPLRPLLVEAQKHAAGRYARTLLAHLPPGGGVPHAASAVTSRAARPLAEPLTTRERDVLRLLASGLSGPEIANALIMTQNTVKTHLKNLYGKLGAHGRDEALRRARELDLI